MIKFPSLSTIFCGVVLGYVAYSIWNVAQIFIPPSCSNPNHCLKSYLHDKVSLDLYVFSSIKTDPNPEDVKLVSQLKEISYSEPWER